MVLCFRNCLWLLTLVFFNYSLTFFVAKSRPGSFLFIVFCFLRANASGFVEGAKVIILVINTCSLHLLSLCRLCVNIFEIVFVFLNIFLNLCNNLLRVKVTEIVFFLFFVLYRSNRDFVLFWVIPKTSPVTLLVIFCFRFILIEVAEISEIVFRLFYNFWFRCVFSFVFLIYFGLKVSSPVVCFLRVVLCFRNYRWVLTLLFFNYSLTFFVAKSCPGSFFFIIFCFSRAGAFGFVEGAKVTKCVLSICLFLICIILLLISLNFFHINS